MDGVAVETTMKKTTTLRAAGLLLALTVLTATLPARQGTSTGVTLEDTRYNALAKFVRGQAGKVVVVDFWADF
jgi:hypothetical protein